LFNDIHIPKKVFLELQIMDKITLVFVFFPTILQRSYTNFSKKRSSTILQSFENIDSD